MSNPFRIDSMPGSLIIVSGRYEPWLAVLEQAGWRCSQVGDLRKADVLFRETGPCVGIVDLSQDEFSLNGIANLVSQHRQVRWIALIRQAQLNSETTCQFIVNFCIDFFTAPVPDAQLLSTVGHQLGMMKLEKKVWPHFSSGGDLGLIGESVSIKRLREQIKRIGPTDVCILIHGESGAGKEQVAKAIHHMSARSQKPFISINCRGMSDKRFIAELFGDGSEGDDFKSIFEQADGGTVLLKDILSISSFQQQRLLHFFQEGYVETQHGSKKVDVRILVANSTDIEKALIDTEFNDELYHYINVLRINVPSLKERTSDIPLIADYYLQKFTKEFNAQARRFDEDVIRMFSRYNWPGNIRELINQVKRMVLMSNDNTLTKTDVDLPKYADGKLSLKMIRERSEREALMLVLESNSGQITHAAKELGISRATMYRLLNKHNLISDEMESMS